MTRLWMTLLVAAVLAVLFVMMWSGWRHRHRRQQDISPLPDVPAPPANARWTPMWFVGVTRAGNWLDRVVVHSLGVPGDGAVLVTSEGLWLRRTRGPDVFVPRDAIHDVRYDNAMAGKVVEKNGLLVITWDHGEVPLDIGLRVHTPSAAEALRRALLETRHGVPRHGVAS